MPSYLSGNRKILLLKSSTGLIALLAVLGCSNAAPDQSASLGLGTQNPTLLQHMGLSDTSYSSMQSHGDDHDMMLDRHHRF